jgi:hypothetical protein
MLLMSPALAPAADPAAAGPVPGRPFMAAKPGQEQKPAHALDACNVVWDSPSRNSHGSMPLGNGDIGINAWVE